MKNKIKIKNLVITASLLTIAIVLDLIMGLTQLRMPFGGDFFKLAMIPLVLIGLLLGVRYGLFAGLVFAMYSFTADYLIYLDSLRVTLESWTGEVWTIYKIILLILLDFGIPFTAFGLAGLFKKAFEKRSQFILSFVLVSFIWWVSASISGIVFWGSTIEYASMQVADGSLDPNIATRMFAAVGDNLWLYSFGYNFIYIFTTLVSSIIIGLSIYRQIALLKDNYIHLELKK